MVKEITIRNELIYVSDNGVIYNSKMKEKKQQIWWTGYKFVAIAGHNYSIHRLVAMAFLDGYSEDLQVHHINEDKSDNRVENLKLMTKTEHQRMHKQIYPLIKICKVCGKEFTPHKTKRKRALVCSMTCKIKLDRLHQAKKKRAINQFSLNGDFIKKWDSGTQIRLETGFFDSNINKCCNGVIHSYKGYVWKYA